MGGCLMRVMRVWQLPVVNIFCIWTVMILFIPRPWKLRIHWRCAMGLILCRLHMTEFIARN